MKKNILVVMMLLIPVLVFGAGEIAVVAKITGTVTMQVKGTSDWKPLKMGTVLKSEATVRTGNDGFASLVYLDDKSTVKMRPKSELKISGAKSAGSIDKTVKMLYGETSYEVTKSGRQFRVETPTSVASVKGTKFLVIVSAENQTTTVYGLSGIVEVSRLDGKGDAKDITTKTKAFVSFEGAVVKDTVSAEEFINIEYLVSSADKGSTVLVEGHEITLSSSIGGTVIPNGTKIAVDNLPFEIAAVPDSNYRFSRWEVISGALQVGSVISPKTTAILSGSDAVVEARFVPVKKSEDEVDDGVKSIPAQLLFEPTNMALVGKKEKMFVGKAAEVWCEAKQGKSFVRWEKISGKVFIESPESPTTKIIVESPEPVVLRARCAIIHELKVNLKSNLGSTKRVVIEYIDLDEK